MRHLHNKFKFNISCLITVFEQIFESKMTHLYLFLIFNIFQRTGSSFVSFRTTNLKCEHDPSIYNGSTNCFIKPFRNGTRLVTIEYNFRKPCNDFWIHQKFLYKFAGSGQYRPWMFDNDEYLCGYYDGTTNLEFFLV